MSKSPLYDENFELSIKIIISATYLFAGIGVILIIVNIIY